MKELYGLLGILGGIANKNEVSESTKEHHSFDKSFRKYLTCFKENLPTVLKSYKVFWDQCIS